MLASNADDHPATANQPATSETGPPLLGVHRFVRRFVSGCDMPMNFLTPPASCDVLDVVDIAFLFMHYADNQMGTVLDGLIERAVNDGLLSVSVEDDREHRRRRGVWKINIASSDDVIAT